MRSIFFDVDGVLIHGYHTRPERRQRWDANLLEDLGVDPAHLSADFFPDTFVQHVLTGKRPLMEALDAWLREHGYAVSPMRFVEYWLAKDSRLNHELIELVARLRQAGNCRLYVATNQEHLRAMDLWLRQGFSALFDDMFYAARLGVLKPQAGFFAAIERRIGLQDEPPLLFDDSEAVIEGARAHGWDAILYDEISACANHPAIAALLEQR